MSMKKLHILMVSLMCLLSLGACANKSASVDESQPTPVQKQEQKKDFKAAIEKKNAELEMVPLELTSYSEKVGATLIEPTHTNFAVDEFVRVEGTVENQDQLQENYVWIKIKFDGEAHLGDSMEYYAPIKDGRFKQNVRLFNGEGEYRVTVLLPSKDRKNYYYDLAKFTVYNVNPNMQRDLTYTPFAQEAGLSLEAPASGYVKENEIFKLKGELSSIKGPNEAVMLEMKKDGEKWKHVLPVKDGKFTYDVPLFYGKGIHELKVYVPDEEKSNYFQEGTVLYIDNESELVTEPIQYMTTYHERGVNLTYPTVGGEETNLTYRIKGTIDKDAPFAKETTHLYITTKKDGEEALSVIPVKDYSFDDEFYLRFGPGTYDVIVSVPEIKEKNSSKFYYEYVAQFTVESTGTEDQRDILPSRGVQSDAPEIIAIAEELITDGMSDREKAKAIYEFTAKSIAYDVEKQKNSDFNWDDSALKVLELEKGICQDYTYLALALLRASGMEARYIAGTAGSGFNFARHAWVEVKVDGEWLTMDPTWGAGYIQKGEFVANYTEDYFEPTEEVFKTHSRHGVQY
ncbi:transglutaminase domain-containing protein [Sporosarcina highlanderae]|uniref:Transglutaminase domain-containing protein n=1 Tax=Sporosarcina highlanderae TaxID=3035916 RepID=A0ABT8JTE0_9BACL|nr:transglutaminase domain-containing protein [Sporosarcina highlanderae]MDN4608423.1 transglutaminase domain-containing protein [Sporosarcina highlanderae]